ncbi:hypothetical protein [Granulicella mallensis]|nr:hypothetical protein [Granulicella mallensis]
MTSQKGKGDAAVAREGLAAEMNRLRLAGIELYRLGSDRSV